jgi:imidazoleglycerol-phosphate dehydratase
MVRKATINRATKETDIACELNLDGTGIASIKSGNAFMDHMLTLFTVHGLFDLTLTCNGDIDVDFHHSAEDIGICLGQAVSLACDDNKGIVRYGTSYVPMDEALARVCSDICGRPNLVYAVKLTSSRVNTFECELAEDFFKAFTDNAHMTVHVDLIRGRNTHHALEAVFKAFGRALSQSCSINPRAKDTVPSSKGII